MESLTPYLFRAWLFCTHHTRTELGVLVVALVLLGGYLFVFAPPADFPPGAIVRIAQGSTTPEIAQELAGAHIISHPRVLRALLRLSGESDAVQTGAYKFGSGQNVFVVAYRLITGSYGIMPVRITFVEGTTVREMATQIEEIFPEVSAQNFLAAAKGQEGYLFPDTYFLQPSMDAQAIVSMLRANFNVKTTSIKDDINKSGHSISDIVTMASIIEREARSTEARRMVSGILWNRIAHNMPLQVDAVFGYIFNRTTYSPSYADLQVDSPYNTYTHKGLPPGPIANPSLDALLAATNPTPSKYLYYLTGRDGQMHYATTYAQHQANQRKYLNY